MQQVDRGVAAGARRAGRQRLRRRRRHLQRHRSPTPARSTWCCEPFDDAAAAGPDRRHGDRRRAAPGAWPAITDADVRIIPPPPVRGIGTAGGFKMIVEDRTGHSYEAAGRRPPTRWPRRPTAPAWCRTPSSASTPGRRASTPTSTAPRPRCWACPTPNVFDTLQTYLGSTFINDFNLLGHTYQVYAQADWPYRNDPAAIGELKTRSASGAMVPLGAVVNLQPAPPAPTGCCATTSTPPPRSRATPRPAIPAARRMAAMEAAARSRAADRLRLRVDRPRLAAEAAPARPAGWCSAWRWCSPSWCWPPSTRA